MEKSIRNIDAVIYKLELALTKAINYRSKVAIKMRQKRKKMVESQKTEAMPVKRQRARGRIILFSKEEKNYEGDINDEIDLD